MWVWCKCKWKLHIPYEKLQDKRNDWWLWNDKVLGRQVLLVYLMGVVDHSATKTLLFQIKDK